MKNSVTYGLLIGVLSAIWLFVVIRATDHSLSESKVAPIEYASIFIPLIGLYFGVKKFRDGELKGEMGFFEALIQSFKILLVGGALAIFSVILYVNYVLAGNDTSFQSFSGRIFGALLVGVIFAFGVSLLLTTKSNKVD